MQANYNPIARFYDSLARCVFGNSIRNAQKYLLSSITEGHRILLIGGGTGWILEDIAAYCPSGLHITYVEHSSKMMERSRPRTCGANQVDFVCRSILDYELEGTYDVVFTPFLFDNFSSNTSRKIIRKIEPHLKGDGKWLYVDFQEKSFWGKVLLKAMYTALGTLCRLETRKLPGIPKLFMENGLMAGREKSFFSDMIQSMEFLPSPVQSSLNP